MRIRDYKEIFLFLVVSVMLNSCSSDETTEQEQPFDLAGTYCLDFTSVGAQVVITRDSNDTYEVLVNDYDGGIRSAVGTGLVDGQSFVSTGALTWEAGTAAYEMNLAIDESTQTLSGIFSIHDDNDNEMFNSSLIAYKGACSFALNSDDVEQIKGQNYLTNAHVELDKIKKISRFRSAAGHNFVDYSGETCVSLKHYFHTYSEAQPPETLPTSLSYFAPVTGTVVVMGQARPSEDVTDYEIDIRLAVNENVIVRIFHINPVSGLKVGQQVEAGELVGTAPAAHLDSGDFAVYVLTNQGYRHISMFEIMSPYLLQQFQERGVGSVWKNDLYYEMDDPYVADIFCENDTWENLRHPLSRYELDFFTLN